MARESVSDVVKDALSTASQATEVGRWLDTPGDGPVVLPPGIELPAVVQHLLWQVHGLEAIVVRLAAEVDALHAAPAPRMAADPEVQPRTKW